MPRLAWFSPMPPARSGPAIDSARVIPELRRRFDIDVFVDEPVAAAHRGSAGADATVRSAHDFVWMHRRAAYDLAVFQMGNSSAHDFIWPYLFRYPGLTVLHDAHLHHARAATLLRQKRPDDYRAEFTASEPDVRPDAAELAVAGFDNHLYYTWPMTRLLTQASRVTALHAQKMAAELAAQAPGAAIDTIRLGHGEMVTSERAARARAWVRAARHIEDDAIVFGLFGGLTPDKRIPQVLGAFAALLPYAPSARLLLVGSPAEHYDVVSDVRARGLEASVIVTGYLDDEAFTDHVAACDVSVNLRWPTAREISGPWLRAMAAGRPTIITDLVHTTDVPGLDPRTWTVVHASASAEHTPDPVAVSIDILDEDHSLRLAMRRLAADAALRDRLGRAAVEYWSREHSHDAMIADYVRVIDRAMAVPAPEVSLPPHLRPSGEERLHQLLAPLAVPEPWRPA